MSFVTTQNIVDGLSFVARSAIDAKPLLAELPGVAYRVFRGYFLYSIYENAFANILCLKTFRHGTDPYAFVRIHFEGNDPDRGGTGGEARWFETAFQTTSPYAQRDQGRFYVVEDVIGSENGRLGPFDFLFHYYQTKKTLKYYAMRSNISFYSSLLPLPGFIKAPITKFVLDLFEKVDLRIYLLAGGLCPAVKFHLNPAHVSMYGMLDENTPNFVRDGSSSFNDGAFEGALATKYEFSIFDIGLFGVIKNGLNTNIAERVRQNREQCFLGLIQLVAAVGLTVFFFPQLLPDSVVNGIYFTAQLIEDFSSSGAIAYEVGKIAYTIFYGPLGIALILASFEV